jgi:O-antigen ligase
MPVTPLTIWISVLPLLVWQGGFEGVKIFWFYGGSIGLIIFWLYRVLKQKKDFVFLRADLFYLLWLLVLTISSLFGVHPFESVIGGSYRHQGVIFFLALWLTGKTIGILDLKARKKLFRGIGFAVLAEGIIVLYQFVFGKLYLGKPLGTMGEAGAAAGLLAIGSYFVFTSFPRILFILPTISILFTQSRSGILALAANMGFILNILSKKNRSLFVALGIIAAGALAVYFSQSKGTSFFENRNVIWPLAFNQIVKRPLFGYGAESGEVVFNQAFQKSGIPLSGLIIDRAHNLFLDVTMWSGTVGLIFFSWWLYLSYKKLKDGKRFAFFSFLIYSMLQPLSVVHWVLLVVILKA